MHLWSFAMIFSTSSKWGCNIDPFEAQHRNLKKIHILRVQKIWKACFLLAFFAGYSGIPFFNGETSSVFSVYLVGGFNQPLSKICSSKLDYFPKVRDENKQYLSCHHLSYVIYKQVLDSVCFMTWIRLSSQSWFTSYWNLPRRWNW